MDGPGARSDPRRLLPTLPVETTADVSVAAPPAPFGHACQPHDGALFCPTADDASRVPSFDGVPLDVDVWNTCQLLRAGHRIRLEIASSAFPKFDRNPSTGEPLGKTTRLERSEQKILHDREHPSHVVLPIVPRKP